MKMYLGARVVIMLILTASAHEQAFGQIDYVHTDLSASSTRSSFPSGDTFIVRIRPIIEDLHPDKAATPPSHWVMRRYLLEACDSVPKVFSQVRYFVALSMQCLTCDYKAADSTPFFVRVVAYNHIPRECEKCPRPLTENDKKQYAWEFISDKRYVLREMDYLRFYVIGMPN